MNIEEWSSPLLWNDWRWQMRQKPACSDISNLAELGLVGPEAKQRQRRVGLTPYNVKLLLDLRDSDPQAYRAESLQSFPPESDAGGAHQWVWAKRQDLPSARFWARLPVSRFWKTLFTGRGSDTEVRALENMYPNTDVLIATAVCARHCSFCFREVGDAQGEASRTTGGMAAVMNAVDAIIARKTPHVLITGGDPLTRSNEQLRQILAPLVESETVQVLRLATRMVVDLPMRFFDEELLTMLRGFAQTMKRRHASLRIVTQVNHPCELTPEAIQALDNIQACGITVLNQTVMLRGVNDDVETLRKLFMHLDRLDVRMHKLFHAMPVEGTEELRVPLRKFRELVSKLHQWLPGTAVPQAVAPTLVGKMPISPSGRWMFPIPFTSRVLCRSFRGELYLFKDA
jgi:lysine 2,3-aminomutase